MNIPSLDKIEVRQLWEVAWLSGFGYRVKYCVRGNRYFMVRT